MPRTFTTKPAPTQETASVPEPSKFTGTIHEVHILDGSSSMGYDRFTHSKWAGRGSSKFMNGVVGVDADLKAAKLDAAKDGLRIRYTIAQFGSSYNPRYDGNVIDQPIENFTGYDPRSLWSTTYLYGTIITVIETLLATKSPQDKVLLKITTDGQNNVADHLQKQCATLIAKVQKDDNFTVTFVGTKEDVAYVTKNLSVDASNSLVYDNTAEGLKEALDRTTKMSAVYRKDVTRGVDVSLNFYSKSL